METTCSIHGFREVTHCGFRCQNQFGAEKVSELPYAEVRRSVPGKVIPVYVLQCYILQSISYYLWQVHLPW